MLGDNLEPDAAVSARLREIKAERIEAERIAIERLREIRAERIEAIRQSQG